MEATVRPVPPRAAAGAPIAILGALGLLIAAVLSGSYVEPAVGLLVTSVIVALSYRSLLSWRTIVAGLVCVILFIPIKRYHLPGSLPFDLEPYRLFVAFILSGWALSLLVDPRVRLRGTFLDAPLLIVLAATLASDVLNPDRVGALGTEVIKTVTFFVSFILVYYVFASIIRRRADVDFLLRVLVLGSTFVSMSAIVERRLGFNVFDNLSRVIPVLQFEGSGEILRGGEFRTIGSAQHPIALSVLFAIVMPLAVYLAKRTENRWWWFAAALLAFGTLSTGSRTGVVAGFVILLVALWLRPRETLRLSKWLPIMLITIHFVLPGALGTIRASFFPPGGLIAEQSGVVPGAEEHSSGRIADLGPSLDEWSNKPLLGQGYGTRRSTGPEANARLLDNQWLVVLLETGIIGALAWLWLFVRVIRRLGRIARRDHGVDGWLAAALAASLAAFGGTMLTYDAFGFIQVNFVFFILLAASSTFVELMAKNRDAAAAA